MKKSVLFVDDQQSVLDGLRRVLHGLQGEWDFDFALSGVEALSCLRRQPFQVIVSDYRMPGMDGAALLGEVMRRSPQTVRIMLSGSPDESILFQTANLVHRFLHKPCQAEEVRSTLNRAGRLSDRIHNPALRELLFGLKTVPSLPDIYMKLMAELQSPEASLDRINELVSRDVGIPCKLLHLVNSSFFGLRRKVESPGQAAVFLGLERLRSLVFSACIFAKLPNSDLPGLSAEKLVGRSQMVSDAARRIALAERPHDPSLALIASMAGIVRDVGTLVLATQRQNEYLDVCAEADRRGIPVWEAEHERFGANHAEVGACLLDLWNIDERIVDAVACHHRPSAGASREFDALTAVHIADVLVQCADRDSPLTDVPFDHEHMMRLGLMERISGWHSLVMSLIAAGEKK